MTPAGKLTCALLLTAAPATSQAESAVAGSCIRRSASRTGDCSPSGVVLGPSASRTGLLAGFSASAALLQTEGERTQPRFRVGAGLDWVHETGWVGALRLDTTHRLDAGLALMAGWWGEGLRSGRGLPLGVTIGPWSGLDRHGATRGGGRGAILYSLWFGRAVVELDLSLGRRFQPRGGPDRGQWTWMLGLGLRLVPWSPFRVSPPA